MIKVINQPEIKAKIEATGAYPNANTPEQYKKMFINVKNLIFVKTTTSILNFVYIKVFILFVFLW